MCKVTATRGAAFSLSLPCFVVLEKEFRDGVVHHEGFGVEFYWKFMRSVKRMWGLQIGLTTPWKFPPLQKKIVFWVHNDQLDVHHSLNRLIKMGSHLPRKKERKPSGFHGRRIKTWDSRACIYNCESYAQTSTLTGAGIRRFACERECKEKIICPSCPINCESFMSGLLDDDVCINDPALAIYIFIYIYTYMCVH